MSSPANNLLSFTPGTIIQSASVNQNFNDVVQLSGNSVGSQLQTLLSNNFSGFVQSGGILTTASGLTVNMSAAYIVVAGITYYMPAQSFTVTASKDTYIDFVPGTVPVYQATAVANNTTSAALYATNAVRMGIVVSGASSITNNNQGGQLLSSAGTPQINSINAMVTDSLGNIIYPRAPVGVGSLIGGTAASANQSTTNGSGSPVAITQLSAACIVPANRRVRIELLIPQAYVSSAMQTQWSIYRGSVASGTEVGYTEFYHNNTNGLGVVLIGYDSPPAGLNTYNAAFSGDGTHTVNTNGGVLNILIMVTVVE